MRARQALVWMLLMINAARPALAGEAMQMTTMEKDEIIAVMPDGQMARAAVTDAKKLEDFRKIAKPIPWCMMFMKGDDRQVYTIDTSAHASMVACEDLVR